MTITIRPGRAEDAHGLYGAWESSRRNDAGHDPRIVLQQVDQDDFVRDYLARLDRPGSMSFVADDDGRVVGMASVALEASPPGRAPSQHATIGYLYVDPSHRRQGVARRLYEAVASWAEKEGADHLEMTVLAANRDAAAFWQSIGFTPFIERLYAPLERHPSP